MWGVDWRTAVFDFCIIITWETPLHLGKMTLLGILGSETFKDPMNMLRYQFAYCNAERGTGGGIRHLQSGPENSRGSQQSGDELLSAPVSFYKSILTIGGVLCLLLCLSSCSSRSLCDNKTSALLFSQGWWNRDDHDRPWKSESGRISNECPIKL